MRLDLGAFALQGQLYPVGHVQAACGPRPGPSGAGDAEGARSALRAGPFSARWPRSLGVGCSYVNNKNKVNECLGIVITQFGFESSSVVSHAILRRVSGFYWELQGPRAPGGGLGSLEVVRSRQLN